MLECLIRSMNTEVVHEYYGLAISKLSSEVVEIDFELFNVDRAVKTLVVEHSMFKSYRCNDSSCLDTDALEVHLDILVSAAELTRIN